MLLGLLLENDLPTADVIWWFNTSLPGHFLGPLRMLVKALAQVLSQSEAALRQQVHAIVVSPPDQLQDVRDSWLQQRKMSLECYTSVTLVLHKQVDGFFILCAVCKFSAHLAMIHMDGIWMTRADGAFKENDLMLAQTTDGFHEVLKIKDDIQLYDTLGDASYLILIGQINYLLSQLLWKIPIHVLRMLDT